MPFSKLRRCPSNLLDGQTAGSHEDPEESASTQALPCKRREAFAGPTAAMNVERRGSIAAASSPQAVLRRMWVHGARACCFGTNE
jgi:hypothetical protein